jgi:hypothetical protein
LCYFHSRWRCATIVSEREKISTTNYFQKILMIIYIYRYIDTFILLLYHLAYIFLLPYYEVKVWASFFIICDKLKYACYRWLLLNACLNYYCQTQFFLVKHFPNDLNQLQAMHMCSEIFNNRHYIMLMTYCFSVQCTWSFYIVWTSIQKKEAYAHTWVVLFEHWNMDNVCDNRHNILENRCSER